MRFFEKWKKDPETVALKRIKKAKPLPEDMTLTLPMLFEMRSFWGQLPAVYRQDFIGILEKREFADLFFHALGGTDRRLTPQDAVALITGFGSGYFRSRLEVLLFEEERPCIPARLEEILEQSPWAAELLPRLKDMPMVRRIPLLAALAKAEVPGVAEKAASLFPSANPEQTLELIAVLGYSRDTKAIPILLEFLETAEWRAQIRAINALTAFDKSLVLPFFDKAASRAQGPVAFALKAAMADMVAVAARKKEA